MAIFSAIGAAFSAISTFIGGLGAVGSFVLKTAVGIGLNLLAQSLAGKPKEPSFALNGELQGGGDLSISFILGKYPTAGSLVWSNTWGKVDETPNAWLTQVIALSDLPVAGLLEVWVDGKKVTYAPTGSEGPMGYAVPEYNNNGANLYIKFYDGTQTTADSILTTNASTSARIYDSARVGRGVAYVIVHARSTRNMFSGFPSLKFLVQGMKLYDPSKDTTVGGSGSHRYSDPATWGGDGDENPMVQAYNLLRGIKWNGQWVYGLQSLPAARLPVLDWIAQINKCRAPITEAGGPQPTYRCSGEIDCSVPVVNALETILTTCQGKISETGGVYRPFVGEPGSAIKSFTDADILSTEGQEFTPFQGIADTINGVSATYPAGGDGWNVKTAPPLLRPDLEAADGNRRLLADIELTFCPYDEQVQRLMKSALNEALRFRRHTITLPPEFWPYAVPGAVFLWNSERNGYVNKLMRLDGVIDKANLDVLIDITEVDPSDYDWDSSTEFHPPTDGDVGVIDVPSQPIADWAAQPFAIVDDDGVQRRPAIRMSWNAAHSLTLDVVRIGFEIRNKLSGEVEWRGSTDNVAAGSVIFSQGLLPNTVYEARGWYISNSDRPFQESDWIEVITLNILITDKDVYLPGIIDDIQEAIGDMTSWLRDGTRNSILELQRITRLTVDQDFGNYTDRQVLRETIASEATGSRAYADNAVLVATGPGSAIAVSILTLEAELENKASASAVTALEARVTTNESDLEDAAADLASMGIDVTALQGDVVSLAQAITSVSAGSVAGDTATANFRMVAAGSPGTGYAARIGLEARAGGAGTYRSASLFLDVPTSTSTPTRVVVLADQFVIADGPDSKTPFIFSGGEARMNVAHIGTVTAGQLKSTNNKIDVNLTSGYISISD
ncbi:putative tail protein [Rhizobium phage RHph_X2_26]|nr:putative tail protein [Rhizobium phage RHph_X2_26]